MGGGGGGVGDEREGKQGFPLLPGVWARTQDGGTVHGVAEASRKHGFMFLFFSLPAMSVAERESPSSNTLCRLTICMCWLMTPFMNLSAAQALHQSSHALNC